VGEDVRTFSVKNFDRFQHYKDRSPPWIKLYNELLDDYAFSALPDASKFHLVAIWLLASRTDNRIPYDPVWVAARISARNRVDLDGLAQAGFIIAISDATEDGAARKQDASKPLDQRRVETETEESISPSPKRASRLPDDWMLPDDWRTYCRENRPDLNADAVAEDFRDYWRARAGPDAAKLDWAATWRRWVRNQKGATNGNRPNGGKQRLTPAEREAQDRAGILAGLGRDIYGRQRAGSGEDREAGSFSLDGSEGPAGTG
jgi:hypothetical protein